jgi:uncharacterized protein (DUF302 family)
MLTTPNRFRALVLATCITVAGVFGAARAAGADIAINPSVLLVFGNPPLGTQFIAADPAAGLDWPVRLLVYQDDEGKVWTAYTDFAWIARRHGIENLEPQFQVASAVIASITASVAAP